MMLETPAIGSGGEIRTFARTDTKNVSPGRRRAACCFLPALSTHAKNRTASKIGQVRVGVKYEPFRRPGFYLGRGNFLAAMAGSIPNLGDLDLSELKVNQVLLRPVGPSCCSSQERALHSVAQSFRRLPFGV